MPFDGCTELGIRLARLSGRKILSMFPTNYMHTFGKKDETPHTGKRRRTEDAENDGEGSSTFMYNWKKKSIFFDLPYWKDNLIRHNLDVMHIEKNVCDNVLWTIMDVDGKENDNLKARLELQEMRIRKALHFQKCASNKYYLPPACYTMGNKEKTILCNFLKNLKTPDGYASNISRCVNVKQHTIFGLKSHDNHILMEQLLPIAVRRILPKKVSQPLIELSNFFRHLCSKVLKVDEVDRLQSRISITLCHLERIFPPSFFDVMEHLPIHLADEAKIGGPVQYRWMYFVERYIAIIMLFYSELYFSL